MLSEIGTGTYGKVLRARRRADGLVVAVKALKKAEAALSWGDVLRTREVEALKQLQHPSIIRLIEVRRQGWRRVRLVLPPHPSEPHSPIPQNQHRSSARRAGESTW